MKNKEKEYRRLPGKGLKRGISSLFIRTTGRLWLGRDHLLSQYTTCYSESYKRFYYRDIQAIVIGKTVRAKEWNLVFFLGFFITAALYAIRYFNGGAPSLFISSAIAGIFLLFLFINWLRGPSCICYLRTSVSQEELPSLNRVKKAMKAITILKPLIEHAQGKLIPEDVQAKAAEMPEKVRSEPRGSSSPGKIAEKEKYYSGTAHLVLFAFLLLDALVSSLDFLYNSLGLTLSGMMISSGIGIVTIVALIKIHSRNIQGELRQMTWVTLGYVCITYILGSSVSFLAVFKNPEVSNNQWELLKTLSTLSPLENPFLMGVYIFTIAFSFIIGMFGIVSLKKFRSGHIQRHRENTPGEHEKRP